MAETKFGEMVCLVGENPLPVYIGIMDLCAEGAEVWLVHSDDTLVQAKAISAKVGNRRRCGPERLVKVDPFAPEDVLKKLIELYRSRPGLVLNFTGGTKVMSAFALQAHMAADAADMRLDRAVYLEDRSHVFRFCDGETRPVSETTRLRVHDIVELHGGRITDEAQWPPCTTGDLGRMWDLFDDNDLSQIHKAARGNGSNAYATLAKQWDAAAGTWRDGAWRQFLTAYTGDDPEHPWWRATLPSTADEFEDWRVGRYSDLALQWRFATGVWLELLAGYLANCALTRSAPVFDDRPLDLGPDIVSGAQVIWHNQPFEADIMLVRQNRLRLISATTGQSQDKIKLKMFEAMARARQVGGGLAYAAVVAPIGGAAGPGRSRAVEECQRSVDPQRRHRVFGKPDLERWMRGSGLDALRDYLNM